MGDRLTKWDERRDGDRDVLAEYIYTLANCSG